MLHDDVLRLSTTNSCQFTEEGSRNILKSFSAFPIVAFTRRKCFSDGRATRGNTSAARRRSPSESEMGAAPVAVASEGLMSTPAPRSRSPSESPPTPPKKPFSAKEQSTEQPRTRHREGFREMGFVLNGTRRRTNTGENSAAKHVLL
jgi:hypothetical protein